MNTGTDGAAPQPLLFDSLPETEPRRRPARRARATTVAEPIEVDAVREPVPRPLPPPMLAPPPAPVIAPAPAVLDPAALTAPELRALVQGLTDQRLAWLVVEAAREVKRRLVPDDPDDSGEAAEPNPVLLRAARQTAGELSGEDA